MSKLPIFTSLLFGISALCWVVIGMGWHRDGIDWNQLLLNIPGVASTQTSSTQPKKNAKTSTAPQSSDNARLILRKSQQNLTQYGSLRAKIRQLIRNGNEEFRAEGIYLQGNQMQLRMECEMKAGSTRGKMLQVCDGQLLWIQLQFGELPEDRAKWREHLQITRRNIDKILQEASLGGDDPRNFLTAELGLGGLPALLAAIDTSMDFTELRLDQIRSQTCYVLEGTWKETKRKRWNDIRATLPKKHKSFVPDNVRIYLEEKTLFPVRIVYLQKQSSRTIPLMAVEFFDVVTNANIDPQQFVYIPPEGVPPKDITHQYIRQLRDLRD